MFDCIVSLITPPLKGAIAVIRISGEHTLEIGNSIFSRKIEKPNYVYYGHIKDNKEVIDEVMLTYFKGPKSFTGEDVIEISCHGSMLIANEIISLIISKGARVAERGEFTSRAFYNGRIDLVQAEAVNSLINAETKEAKTLSLYSLGGETSSLLDPIKTKLADILSNIEVNIDYPEYQDIEEVTNDKIINEMDELISTLDSLISKGEKSKLIVEGINVALVGRPNVGKSSLLNELLGKDKAIVTNIPGTTRDIVEGQINLNGLIVNLLDTAGIRDSDDVVEQIGINKSKETINNADLVIVVLEKGNITPEDNEILEYTKDKKRLIVYNKDDLKENKSNDEEIYISCINHDIKALTDALSKLYSLDKMNALTPSLTSSRDIGLLNKAKENLINAKQEALMGISLDLISTSIKASYDALKEILGEEVKVDLTEEIFSRFCVGK